jgi:hypothetical protein
MLKQASATELHCDSKMHAKAMIPCSVFAQKRLHNKSGKTYFLLLGNLPGGSTDSTQFGLVDKGDFVGKTVRVGK